MSKSREDELLQKHRGYIKRNVGYYISKCPNQSDAFREDLTQEANLAFLKYVRRHPDLLQFDEVDYAICAKYMKQAMYCFHVKDTGIAETRWHINKCKHDPQAEGITVTNYEYTTDVEDKYECEDENTSLSYMALKAWVKTLTYIEQTILNMRICGYSDREIGKSIGCVDRNVDHIVERRIRPSYIREFGDPHLTDDTSCGVA